MLSRWFVQPKNSHFQLKKKWINIEWNSNFNCELFLIQFKKLFFATIEHKQNCGRTCFCLFFFFFLTLPQQAKYAKKGKYLWNYCTPLSLSSPFTFRSFYPQTGWRWQLFTSWLRSKFLAQCVVTLITWGMRRYRASCHRRWRAVACRCRVSRGWTPTSSRRTKGSRGQEQIEVAERRKKNPVVQFLYK